MITNAVHSTEHTQNQLGLIGVNGPFECGTARYGATSNSLSTGRLKIRTQENWQDYTSVQPWESWKYFGSGRRQFPVKGISMVVSTRVLDSRSEGSNI